MNNKGMAISSILYTILVLFLVLLFGILGLISSAKTTFDTLKNKLLTDLNDTKPRVTAVEDDFVDNKIIVSVFSRKYISSYYISQSVDTLSRDSFNANSNKQDLTYPTGSFKVDYMKQNNNQYYIYLKDIHDNVYSYTIRIEQNNNCGIPTGTEYTFDYTGDIQTFDVPCTGAYKLEAWGAQGGKSADNTENSRGGYGAYSVGNININHDDTIYVAVGGAGKTCTTYGSIASGQTTCGNDGGYNGGGTTRQYTNTTLYGSGGGATHIATVSGTLSEITSSNLDKVLMVAGAGGGSSYYATYQAKGGNAGGISGMSGEVVRTDRTNSCTGGNQTSAGGGDDSTGQAFGHGGNITTYVGPGGGSGLYGGGTSEVISCGGSSYIGNSKLTDKKMVGYNCTTSTNTNTYTVSNTCTSATPTSDCSKQGNGYARITLVSITSDGLNYQIISDSLDNKSRMTSLAGSTTTFSIKVRSYNSGNTKYELYYKSSNNDVVVTSVNEVTGTIQENETKTIKVTVKNTGSESTIVRFYVAGSTTRENPIIDGKEIISSVSDCQYATGYTWDFDYTGDVQTFEAPCEGVYRIETWGAQGTNTYGEAGKGGYTAGSIRLDKDNSLYVYVGDNGSQTGTAWNGGGIRHKSGGTTCGGAGGGGTDIRVVGGAWNDATSLRSRIMVAGSGGGAGGRGNSTYYSTPGYGGGLTSAASGSYQSFAGSTAATQIAGGYSSYSNAASVADSYGLFGMGPQTDDDNCCGAGGGSGWYGGGGGCGASASGGSAYISGHTGSVAVTSKNSNNPKSGCTTGTTSKACSVSPYGYEFTNTVMIDGSGCKWTNTKTSDCSGQPQPNGTITAGHSGNGYARITYLGKSNKTLAAKVLIDNPAVKTNPTLTTTATTSAESGLYSMNVNNGFSGENGKSYYFRGVVNNNYVSFAGKTWRIVRINEDGTVRLILDEDMDANTYTMNNVYTGASQMYFSNTNMQGTPEHPNARYALNDWYNNNIGNNATYSNKVTNSQQNYFCEEAKIVYSNTENVYSGTTFMKVLDNTYAPNFECNRDQNGHQYVDTNIGLLTIDEILLAGAHTSASNSSFYLSKSYLWWLMSPGGLTADQIGISWAMTSNGTISVTCVHRDFMKLRPVINLKYNVEVTGSGTSSDPYVVKNN